MSKIPKIIFSFWEGNQFTQLHALTMYSCALYNPDFKIIIYTTDDIVFEIQYGSNEHNFKYTNIYNINLLKNIPNLEFVNVNIHSEINFQGKLSPVWKSDIIRIFKLYEHGGIYIDFDILFINKIPEYLLNIKEDCGFNKYDNTVNNAFILSTKNCNFINKVKDEILLKFKSNNINYEYMQFGPTLINSLITNDDSIFYIPNDMTCPYIWNEMDKLFLSNINNVTSNTFCIHWYNGSNISREYVNNFNIKNINKNKNSFENILYFYNLNTIEMNLENYIIPAIPVIPAISVTWNTNLENSFNRIFNHKTENETHVIEIGCFEGYGTLKLNELFCSNKNSTITCIDPLEDLYVKNNEEFSDINPMFIGQYNKFITNTNYIKDKIILERGLSNDVLPKLKKKYYDFIYIDGDHSENQVYLDGLNSIELIKNGGIILFDDYNWTHKTQVTKNGIEKFITEFNDKIIVLFRGPVQCAVKVK